MIKRIAIVILLLSGLFTNKSLAQKAQDTSSQNKFADPIEPLPEFPGGYKKFLLFIHSNLRTVKGANNKKVFMSFTVQKDGGLADFKIERGINKEADTEALRVIRLSPKWKPAVYNGHPQITRMTVPMIFPK